MAAEPDVFFGLTTGELLAVVQILLTVPIAIYVAMASRSFSHRQGEREVRNAWLTFDLGVLANKELLAVTDKKLHPDKPRKTDDAKHWRWVCYGVRNPLENFFAALAKRHRFWWSRPICHDPAFLSLRSCLTQFVGDDDFQDIVARFTADSRFAYLCLALTTDNECDYRPERAGYQSIKLWRLVRYTHRCTKEPKPLFDRVDVSTARATAKKRRAKERAKQRL